jgi:hypothetical protein
VQIDPQPEHDIVGGRDLLIERIARLEAAFLHPLAEPVEVSLVPAHGVGQLLGLVGGDVAFVHAGSVTGRGA